MKIFRMVLIFGRIGFRNVKRNPRRSFLTIFAITSGLVCLLIFQSLKQGLHREMVSNTTGLDAGDVQVHASGYKTNLASLKPIRNPGIVYRALQSSGIEDFAPRLKSYALIIAGKSSVSVLLSGIVPEQESRVTFISDRIVKGDYFRDNQGILISSALAMDIGRGIGDQLAVMVRNTRGEPSIREFVITGIYKTELATFDLTHIFLPLNQVQSFLGTGNVITEIAGRNNGQIMDVLHRLQSALPENDYMVWTWKDIAPDVDQLIQLNNATMNLLILIVFAIVAMGIINTMTTVTFERFRELGTLAAVGTPPGGILGLIVLESCFIGLISMVFGNLAGYGICAYLAEYGINLTHLTSANQYFATTHVLKAYLVPGIFIRSNLITLTTALIAGIYPAWKASRLEPARAIMHA